MANIIEAVQVLNPKNETDIASRITITHEQILLIRAMKETGYHVFQCWIKANANKTVKFTCGSDIKSVNVTTSWQKIEWVFKTENASDVKIRLPVGRYWFYNTKLEKGNKVTDWTPAPEDVDADISNAQTSANNAQTTADSAQSTADTANTTANTALSRVTIKDTRDTNQNPQWYMTNYPKQIVQEFKFASSIGLSGETYCYLETTVPWDDLSGGFPKQVAKINGKQYWRVGTSNTTWSAWNDPGATATNYMSFDTTNGLVVSQDATANAGNVQIKSDGFRIRNGTTVNASFLGNTITLGQNSTSSSINLCGDKGSIKINENQFGRDALTIMAEDVELYSDVSTSLLCKPGVTSGGYSSTYSYCHTNYESFTLGSLSFKFPVARIGTYGAKSGTAYTADVGCGVGAVGIEGITGANKSTIYVGYDGLDIYSTSYVKLEVNETGINPYIEITDDTTNNSGYGRIYMAANSIVIDPIDRTEINSKLTVSDRLYANGNVVVPNTGIYYATSTSGDLWDMVRLNAVNATIFGTSSWHNKGITWLSGGDLKLESSIAGTNYTPYYRKGDSVSTRWFGAGFISASMKTVYFSIPLAKPVIGNPTVTVTSVGGITARQQDKYLYGSTSSAYATPSSYTAVIEGTSFIRVTATMPNTTNVTYNNAPCGIDANIKITFS